MVDPTAQELRTMTMNLVGEPPWPAALARLSCFGSLPAWRFIAGGLDLYMSIIHAEFKLVASEQTQRDAARARYKK
jgi:hypothetical protein